jgi:hypothetical protein
VERGPVFVGGTGRCGTHAVAALAALSGRYTAVAAELRLHVSQEGLPGFTDGTLNRHRLVKDLRGHWWRHRAPWACSSPARGAHRIAPRHRYIAAVARLAASPPGADRLALSRCFVRRLLDPLAPQPGAWVEKSPDNCAAAGFLNRLFPDLRLVHVIRDGRDVACSFMRVPWAPDDFTAALALWERRLLEAHSGRLQVPAGRVHSLTLEDLVWSDRDRSYGALLGFLGIPDAPELRSFFDSQLTADRARIGRWRSDLPPSEHPRVEALYRGSLQRLEAAGVGPLPGPVPADGPGALAEPCAHAPGSAIDPWSETTAGSNFRERNPARCSSSLASARSVFSA